MVAVLVGGTFVLYVTWTIAMTQVGVRLCDWVSVVQWSYTASVLYGCCVVFVVGLLATKFSPMVAVLVGGTFVLYVAWTIAMTQVRLVHPSWTTQNACLLDKLLPCWSS
jgi:predicted membrane channel-forming protein YqfA (hemolysin III family)